MSAAEAEEKRRSFDRSRVDMMRGYAETDGCRRAFVLSYFGEPFEPPCGALRQLRVRAARPWPRPPACCRSRSARAWSPTGSGASGVVQRYDDDAVVVLFDEMGYKTLALDVVRERDLLGPA